MGLTFSKKSAILLCLLSSLLFTSPLWAAGNFTVSATPSTINIGTNGQGTVTIATTVSGGFNSSISLSASGMPMGVGVTFNPATIPAPGNGTSTMTITVVQIARAGTYPITVTGNGGGIKQTVIVTLIVTTAGQANFTIAAWPSALTISQGNQGTTTIYTTIAGGFNSSVVLSASGMPAGVGVSFSPQTIPAPGDGSSTMTVTVSSGTPTGSYPITVTGNGGGIQQNTMVTLTVSAGPDFSISASPSSITIPQGNQGTSTITTTISGGFNSSIALSYSGAPSGTTVAFNPQTIPAPGNGTSTMTITVGSGTPTGTYPITVTGNGGGIQHNTTVTLTVTAPADFTITASPSSITIPQGNQGTSTITTTISGGFNSSIALSYSGAPSGTTVAFNPQTIPAPGNGSSTMTITVGSGTPTGTYPITVTGNGGGIQHNTTVTLTVTAPADFTISASPSSITIPQGNQGTSTITTTISNGFNSSIALSYSGAPSGTTVAFNPQTIPAPGNGTSTMTITVGSGTPTGTYPITVTGNGGGIQHNTTVTLTVTSQGGQNFTISASPSSLSVAQGNQGTSTITTTITGGFNSSIALSASGMPPGVGVSFNPQTIPAPGNGSSTMTINVIKIARLGTYPITVTGNGGGIQQQTTVMLTVVSSQDFSVSLSPASLSITQRNQGTTTVTTSVIGGFNNSIALSATGVPTGTTVNFNPQTIPAPGNGSSTMTIAVDITSYPGTYNIQVVGTGGGIQRYAQLTLTIVAAPNYVISAFPASLSIAEGSQGTSTITTLSCCGFTSSIALSASGAPSGTGVTLNPGTIPAPGNGNSIMTMTVASNTPTGTYPITVAGNGGGIQNSATVTLTVTGGQPPANANFQESYTYQLQSSFGHPPYSYQITSGALPSGLTMNGSGKISGTATAVGKFPFTVLVKDSSQPQQQQTSSYTLNVVIGMDTYSGLTAAPIPGCTQGYFQLMKVPVGGYQRWIYVSPSCNAFYQFAVYDADPGFIYGGIMQSRYGNDSSKWATHSLQREMLYGFNSNDIYASDYVLPVPKGGNSSGATPKLPFLLFFATTNNAIYHPQYIGLPEAVKDLCIGQDSNGYKGFCNYTLDVVDPNWVLGNQGELALQISEFPSGFNAIPWIVAISLGDADYLFMFKGNGSGLNGASIYPHPAQFVATDAFNYNLPPVNGNWQRPILYAKVGWACNAAANDPVNFPPGQSFLERKYGNIAALNAAWGSNYTSFCDDGGFGTGTGVLDEDGHNTLWFGSHDYYNQAGMNPNLKADLNQYLYQMALQIYTPQINVVRGYDVNHVLMCGFYGGVGDGGMRPQVAQALHDSGCQMLVLNWNQEYNSEALASNAAVYNQIGLPATIFYATTAQLDSDMFNYPQDGEAFADYPTQQLRGQHYASDSLAMYGAQAGSNNDYYLMGLDFWSLTDNSNENRNLGFISLSDNVYDGICAVRLVTIDQWGYPCGGEVADYGDLTDGVTQSNSTVLQQFINDLIH